MSSPILGISIGDPNGIGPEVVLKTFSDSRMFDFCTPVVYAHPDFLSSQNKHFGLNVPVQVLKDRPQRRVLNVASCWDSVGFQHQSYRSLQNLCLCASFGCD